MTPDPWTIVCRCEELYAIDILEAIRRGARTLDEVKRLTRCGMGPCQWKGCGPAVAALLVDELGISTAEVAPPRIRPPVRPVRLSTLVAGRPAPRPNTGGAGA